VSDTGVRERPPVKPEVRHDCNDSAPFQHFFSLDARKSTATRRLKSPPMQALPASATKAEIDARAP
jgi:hypothetical protein